MKDDLPMPHYTKICAEFELVTPAFIGSADKDKAGCIDPKAIKAALRYWWRVVHWHRFAQDKTLPEALAAMHAAEAHLFGGAANEHGSSGQGVLQVLVKHATTQTREYERYALPAGIRYLLGQGLLKNDESGLRPALQAGKFNVVLIARHIGSNTLDENTAQQIGDTVRAFGLLGGLGARQNRGFGRVVLHKYAIEQQTQNNAQADTIPATVAAYQTAIQTWFAKRSNVLPPIPAQNGPNRFTLIVPQNDEIIVPQVKQENNDSAPPKTRRVKTPNAWELLNAIGEQFLLERSWGTNQKKRKGVPVTLERHYAYHVDNDTPGKIALVAEQNHPFDHDWIKTASNQSKKPLAKGKLPYRILFGLPYGFGKCNINVALKPDLAGRRASPLCIHVTVIAKKPVAVLYALQSTFLPDTAKLTVNCKIPFPDVAAKDLDLRWDILDNFFARFDPSNADRKPFP